MPQRVLNPVFPIRTSYNAVLLDMPRSPS